MNHSHPLTKTFLCAALAPLLSTTHAIGAVITWDANAYQVVATDQTSVSTAGTLLTAVAFSSGPGYGSYGPQTINGVTFDCLPLFLHTDAPLSANASFGFDAGGNSG